MFGDLCEIHGGPEKVTVEDSVIPPDSANSVAISTAENSAKSKNLQKLGSPEVVVTKKSTSLEAGELPPTPKKPQHRSAKHSQQFFSSFTSQFQKPSGVSGSTSDEVKNAAASSGAQEMWDSLKTGREVLNSAISHDEPGNDSLPVQPCQPYSSSGIRENFYGQPPPTGGLGLAGPCASQQQWMRQQYHQLFSPNYPSFQQMPGSQRPMGMMMGQGTTNMGHVMGPEMGTALGQQQQSGVAFPRNVGPVMPQGPHVAPVMVSGIAPQTGHWPRVGPGPAMAPVMTSMPQNQHNVEQAESVLNEDPIEASRQETCKALKARIAELVKTISEQHMLLGQAQSLNASTIRDLLNRNQAPGAAENETFNSAQLT